MSARECTLLNFVKDFGVKVSKYPLPRIYGGVLRSFQSLIRPQHCFDGRCNRLCNEVYSLVSQKSKNVCSEEVMT